MALHSNTWGSGSAPLAAAAARPAALAGAPAALRQLSRQQRSVAAAAVTARAHAATSLAAMPAPSLPQSRAPDAPTTAAPTCRHLSTSRPHRTSVVAAAKAAAAPMAVAAAEAWFTATGVPLLEVLQQMTLQQAALKSAGLIVATAVGVMLGNKLLDIMGTKMDSVAEKTRSASGLTLLIGTALGAVHRPAKMLLPVYGGFYSLLVATAFADVAVARVDSEIHNLLFSCSAQVLVFLKGLAQLMQDTSELVLIVFVAWFLISWKDELINVVTTNLEVDESDEPNITRVLVPLGNVLSWCIVIAATLTTLTAFGINVQPLLAVGSIGTVAVGFAAQSTMQNVVSALQIYSSRPFIVGDRVQLKSLSGSTIATGVVEHIAPMRTVLRADNKLPIYICNKDVMNLIIVNESKLKRSNVMSKLPLIECTLTLRYCDVEVVPEVEKAITQYLSSHPQVDAAISPRCVLSEFTEAGPQLAFRALLVRSAGSRQAFIRGQMLREAERIVRQCGGYLATGQEFGAALPPSPPLAPAGATSEMSIGGSTVSGGSGEFGSAAASSA